MTFRSRVRVTLGYVTELSYETSSSSTTTTDKTAKFVVPTKIVPRYSPTQLGPMTASSTDDNLKETIWSRGVGDDSNWSEHRRKLIPAYRVTEVERQLSPLVIVVDIQVPSTVTNADDLHQVVCSSHMHQFEWHQVSPCSGCGIFSCSLNEVERKKAKVYSTSPATEHLTFSHS